MNGVVPGPVALLGAGAPVASAPVLDIRDLSIAYATPEGLLHAVSHVNLALAPGEVVGLAGESGSGKSTLVLGMTRLLRPPAIITGGSVRYRGRRVPDGVDILELNAKQLRRLRWREISIVFQSAMNALNPVLRVRDQLGDVLDAHLKLGREERQARLESLVDLIGVPRERLKSYPHELSGGMRQRIMIAMALAVDPELVIMDEPTTALDLEQQELNFAIVFVTHDLSLLLEIADRIMILYAGQLVELGSAEEVHYRTAHPYTRGLLESFPSVHGPRRQLAGIPGSPPDLRSLPPGCPFAPRCLHARPECLDVDMHPIRVPGSLPGHVTACPFVMPGGHEAGDSAPARKSSSPALKAEL